MIVTVINRFVVKALQSLPFQTGAQRGNRGFAELHVVNDVAICTLDTSTLTILVTIIVEREVQKQSREEACLKQH